MSQRSLLRFHNNEDPQSSQPDVCDICLINILRGFEADAQQATLKASVTSSGHKALSAQRVRGNDKTVSSTEYAGCSKFPDALNKYLKTIKAHLLGKYIYIYNIVYVLLGNEKTNLTWKCAQKAEIYSDSRGKTGMVFDFSRT